MPNHDRGRATLGEERALPKDQTEIPQADFAGESISSRTAQEISGASPRSAPRGTLRAPADSQTAGGFVPCR